MITNSASHMSPTKHGKENILVILKTTEVKIHREAVFSKRHILKWFSIVLTLLIMVAGIDPDVFGIPMDLRPWVFVASIFWFLAFCAGVFSS
jgi:hypothetical protein